MKTSASPEERADTAQAEDLAALRDMVEKAKAGDQSAFAGLYEMYSLEVYRTLRSMVRNEDLIQDLQQDVFLTAFSSLSQLQNSERILPWLRKIAVNKVKDEYKRKKPLLFSELYTDETEVPEFPETSISVLPEDALDQKETADLVRDILKTLTEEQQLVIGMHYYEGIPVKDIAKTLGVSEGSVSARLNRGRARVEKEVRQLESKGIKLYGLQPMPFLVALLRRWMLPESKREAAKAVVLENAGLGTAAVTAKTAGTLLGAVVVKLLIGAAILLLFGGGAAAIYGIGRGRNRPEPQPVSVETMSSPTDMTDLEPVLASEDPNPTDRPSEPETEPATEADVLPAVPNQPDAPEDQNRPDAPEDQNQPDDPEDPNQPDESEDQNQPDEPDRPNEPDESGEPIPPVNPDPSETPTSPAESDPPVPPVPTDTEPDPEPDTDPEPETASESETEPEPDNTFSGDWGTLRWQVDPNTRILRISGNGTMDSSFLGYPWNSDSCYDKFDTLIVEEGVRSLAYSSFSGYNLLRVTLPHSLEQLSGNVFWSCGFEEIYIPENVSEIGEQPFVSCKLKRISVDSNNKYYTAVNGVIYNKAMTELVVCASGKTGSLTIPAGVEKIKVRAFKSCELDSVTISSGMTELSEFAFSESGIKLVVLPTGLRTIGQYAFYRSQIQSIRIPEGVTALKDSAFNACEYLREVHIPASVNSFGNDLFTDSPNVVIYAPSGSAAEQYAREHGISFVAEDDASRAPAGTE